MYRLSLQIKESLIHTDLFAAMPKITYNDKFKKDPNAQKLLEDFFPADAEKYIAVDIPAFGDCLPVFLSKGTTGVEHFDDEIRLMTVRTMIKYRNEIESVGQSLGWNIIDQNVDDVEFNYVREVGEVAQKYGHIGLHGLFAMSIALQVKINLRYPKVNGEDDMYEKAYGTMFCREAFMNKPLKQIEGIMTMFGEQRHLNAPSTANIWRGNHFVLLLEKAVACLFVNVIQGISVFH